MLNFVLTAAFKQCLTPSLSPHFRCNTGKQKLGTSGHGHGECVRVRVSALFKIMFRTHRTVEPAKGILGGRTEHGI